MADKCTQTDWSWLQDQIIATDEKLCRESDTHVEEQDVAVEISVDAQERVKTPLSESVSRGATASWRESRRMSAVRYSDESRLFQTSPEFDEFVAMLTDLKSDDEDDEEEAEEIENVEETEQPVTPPPPPYPSLSSFNLPWPAILQYLRESESLSSEYFSLAKPQQDSSLITATAQQCRPQCLFCEQKAQVISLLPVEGDKKEEPAFCCTELRDYCVLVTAHTQRIMIKAAEQRPGKINIAVDKTKIKKTAQERALEILRRKRKWEENTRKLKLLESSSVYAMARQSRTLQFSLAEPTCMNRGWASVGNEEAQTKAARKQRKREAMKVPLAVSSLMSEEVSHEVLNQLEQHYYSNGVTSAILLPDCTGQCYYPSGRSSVHIAQLYPGVLMYLIYENSDNGVIEGYLDELGRAWYGNGSTLKMVCRTDECYQFDAKGKLKTHWLWSDTSSYSVHLPLVLRVNSHITVRYNNQDDVTLTFSAAQQLHRFKISRKLTQINHSKNKDKYITELKKNLQYLQANFDFHLSRLQLAAQLVQSRDKSLLPPLQPHHVKTRTRSTGTVTFKQ